MLRLLQRSSKASGRMKHDGTTPKIMKATIDAYSEGPTALISKDAFKFVVDEPPKLGGKGLGANPLTHFLGALAACTSYTLEMITKEKKLAPLNRASWSATGTYDLRGLQATGSTDARFQSIELKGIIDTENSQEDLNALIPEAEKRCIVAATCAASGMEIKLALNKGKVARDCQPACELHNFEDEKGTTGKVDGNPGREADSPQFSGTSGRRSARSRGFHTSAGLSWANGEDVAREHLGADKEPQIQKETSGKGAPETAGGAYASRDSPKAQAGPPTEGKSDEQLVKEQTAGATTKPEESLHSEEEPEKPPSFAEKAADAPRHGESPLGRFPAGEE